MFGLTAVYGLACVIDAQGVRASDWLTCNDSPPSLPDSIAQTGAKHHMAMEISVSRDCITFHSLGFTIDLSSIARNVKVDLKVKILSEASQAWRVRQGLNVVGGKLFLYGRREPTRYNRHYQITTEPHLLRQLSFLSSLDPSDR
jgi:hypothetical protein